MIFDKIKAVLAEQLDVNEDEITMDSTIQEDLGADSLDVVEMIMSLEEEFDIEVPDEAAQEMKTVGDVVRFVESLKD